MPPTTPTAPPSTHTDPAASVPSSARLRSGTAARLAGVPVATLRVWERRYGVVDAPKTPTGQRVYSAHDVQRLRLLRQLSDSGHGIGSVATLPLAALQALFAHMPPPPAAPASRERMVHVVGRAAAAKLAGQPGCRVVQVFDSLAQALAASSTTAASASASLSSSDAAPDVLLVQQASLQPDAAQAVWALARQHGTPAVIVLYTFGAEAVVEQLRAAGALVRREPVRGTELARLIGLAAAPADAQTLSNPAPLPAAVNNTQRRFSDAGLARLAEQTSSVACECPRHLAEICMQLVGFEHYSADCGTRSPADAALHAQLSALAASARAQFEQALESVALQEGLLSADLMS